MPINIFKLNIIHTLNYERRGFYFFIFVPIMYIMLTNNNIATVRLLKEML